MIEFELVDDDPADNDTVLLATDVGAVVQRLVPSAEIWGGADPTLVTVSFDARNADIPDLDALRDAILAEPLPPGATLLEITRENLPEDG